MQHTVSRQTNSPVIHWKAVEQYFTVVLFVFQFTVYCDVVGEFGAVDKHLEDSQMHFHSDMESGIWRESLARDGNVGWYAAEYTTDFLHSDWLCFLWHEIIDISEGK